MRNALNMQKLKSVYDQVAKRYDFQHSILTARSDQRGRKILVEKTVGTGDRVLDCGSGTGSTALLAAQKVGPDGKVMLFDISDEMLSVAKDKAVAAGVRERLEFQTGDMLDLPFEDNIFDAVLSTYSICPLHNPARGALELYRVVKPGGNIGIAHSAEPEKPLVKWLENKIRHPAFLNRNTTSQSVRIIMSSHNHHRRRNRARPRPSHLLLGMLIFALAACTAQSGQEAQATSRQPTDDTTPSTELQQREERRAAIPSGLERVPGTSPAVPVTGEAPSALLDEIIADLMTRKNIRREEIAVTRAEAVIWPDGSLGCPKPGEMYTDAPVDGYWVVLRWAEKEFDYRASAKGQFLLCENTFKVRRPVG